MGKTNKYNFYDIDGNSFDKNFISLLKDIIGKYDSDIIFSSKRLLNILNNFSMMEKTVIIKYYGLVDGDFNSLEKVGDFFAVSKYHISSIKNDVLSLLIKPYYFYQFCFTEEYLVNNSMFDDKINFKNFNCLNFNQSFDFIEFLIRTNDLKFKNFEKEFRPLNLCLDSKNALINFNVWSVDDFLKLDNNMFTNIFNFCPSVYFELRNKIDSLDVNCDKFIDLKLKDMDLIRSRIDYSIDLSSLGFSKHAFIALRYASINSLESLIKLSSSDLFKLRKFNSFNRKEIIDKINYLKSCIINDDIDLYEFSGISFESNSDIMDGIASVKKNNELLKNEIGKNEVGLNFYNETGNFVIFKSEDSIDFYDLDNSPYKDNFISFIKNIDFCLKSVIFSSSVICDLLKNLDSRDEDIIASRYGLYDGVIQSLGSLGDKYNLTRTGVDYICKKNMRLLHSKYRNSFLFTKKCVVDNFLLTSSELLVIDDIDNNSFINNYEFVSYLKNLSDKRNSILTDNFGSIYFETKKMLSYFNIFSIDEFNSLNSFDATKVFNFNPIGYYEVKEVNSDVKQTFLERLVNNNLNILFNNVDYNMICLKDLGLSSRSESLLFRANIYSLGDLIRLSDAELKNIRQLGVKSYEEVMNVLSLLGLSLNYGKLDSSKIYDISKSKLLDELSYLLKKNKDLKSKNEFLSAQIKEKNNKTLVLK